MLTFSIVIPMYNAQQYIRECLDSIMNQTYKSYEIIVVDDGSEDQSVSIVNKYKLNYKNINLHLIQKDHKNAGAARNIGMNYAKGDYLLFLDADDKFSHELLAELAEKIISGKKKDIIIWDGVAFDNKTGEIKDIDYLLNLSNIKNEEDFKCTEYKKYLYQFTAGVLWNKAFLRDFIRDKTIKFQEISKANDVYFAFIAMAEAHSIGIINKKMTYYRYNNEKSLQGGKKSRSIDFYEALIRTKLELEQRNLYDDLEISFGNVCLVHCINELNMRLNGDDFSFIYRCLKQYMIIELGIQKLNPRICYQMPYYEMLQKILNKSVESYLYDEMVALNDGIIQTSCKLEYIAEENSKKIWPFPFCKIPPKSNLILYGAGKMGADYEKQIQESQYCNLILWVDKKYREYQKKNVDVRNPEEINNVFFDIILIAIKEEKARNEVKHYLNTMGVKSEQII